MAYDHFCCIVVNPTTAAVIFLEANAINDSEAFFWCLCYINISKDLVYTML